MKEKTASIKLVIVSSQHPVLGVLLIPYISEKKEDGTINLIEQAFHASHGFSSQMNETEQKAVDIASHYTEKSLMKMHSKEKNSSDFLRKLSADNLKKVVRPYIEKKLLEMVELIRLHKLPLYQKQTGSNTLYEHNAYSVSPYTDEVSFDFTATEEVFSYAIRCQRDGVPVSLRDMKPVIVLTTSPASLLMGRELHVFRDIETYRLLPFTHKESVNADAAMTDKYLEKIVLPAIRNHHVTSSGLNISEKPKSCEAILSINDDATQRNTLKLTFQYGEQRFPAHASSTSKVAWLSEENGKKGICYFKRDALYEDKAVALLQETGLKQASDGLFMMDSIKENVSLSNWIENHKEKINKNFKLISGRTGGNYCLDNIEMEQTYTDERDWFDLHITVTIGKLRVPFTHFRKHILGGIREYVLPNERVIILPEEWFNKYTNLFQIGEERGEEIRIKHPFIGIFKSAIAADEEKKN